jgi:hypothetical protein
MGSDGLVSPLCSVFAGEGIEAASFGYCISCFMRPRPLITENAFETSVSHAVWIFRQRCRASVGQLIQHSHSAPALSVLISI